MGVSWNLGTSGIESHHDGKIIDENKKIVKMSAAYNIIKIDGIEYSKCYIPDVAYKECLTPCALCNSKVQAACPVTPGCQDGFCGEEQVCYININDVQEDD